MATEINRDAPKTTWFKPVLSPSDKAIITPSRIILPRHVAEKFTDQRAAIGISEGRHAIFIKPDKGGYKILSGKKCRPWLHIRRSRFEKRLAELIKGDRKIVDVMAMGDGSFGLFL